ncbi:MAG: NDP-sugar synthase [Candidatus Micrarchaeota archaeon]
MGVLVVKAILLAGGYGTRLMPLTLRLAKVMVPVAGKPVLEHLVRACAAAGVEEAVISLNTHQGAVESYFGDGSKFGVPIRYVFESSMSDEDKFGAIGAIEYAARQAGISDGCVVINGDNIFYGLDLRRLEEHHGKKGGSATLALFTLNDKRDVEQYSAVKVDRDGRIVAFQEKPKVDEAVSNLASVGIYRLGEQVLREYLPGYVAEHKKLSKKPDRVGDLWQNFFVRMPIYGHAFSGMWGDTNSPKTYVECHKQAMQYLVGKPFSQEFQCQQSGRLVISPSAVIDRNAIINGPAIIEDGCTVAAGAVVGAGAHLMRNVRVEGGAIVNSSIVFENAVIGSEARLGDCVIDANCVVGRGAHVGQYSLLGFSSKVGCRAVVGDYSRVWPFIEVGEATTVSGDLRLDESLFIKKLAGGVD